MQVLHNATEDFRPADVACEVCTCVPTVMQFIRVFSQQRRAKTLSVQQFRALGIVRHRGGISLSGLAEQLGLAVPSASRLVGGLVRRGYLGRTPIPDNRRQLRLTLRAGGEAILSDTLAHTYQGLADRLEALDATQRAVVVEAMRLLTPLFDPNQIDAATAPTKTSARRPARRKSRPAR